jgi:nucleoid DNA-binding protein
MGKAELKKYVAQKTGITGKEAGIVIEVVLQGIVDGLTKKGKATMPNFGRFEIKRSAARMARNPRTGEPVQVAEKDVVRFKPAIALKEKVAQR